MPVREIEDRIAIGEIEVIQVEVGLAARESLVRVFEASDVAVLFLAGKAIEAGGLLAAGEPADRGLMSLDDVAGALSRLSRNGLLTVRREGERRWRVSWGERAIKIARTAGVKVLPPVVEEPVAEILTRS
jgi:hypothetical protein